MVRVIRTGLHTSECDLHRDGLAGVALHIGAGVVSLPGPGEVLVTSTVCDLVAGSGIEFTMVDTLKGFNRRMAAGRGSRLRAADSHRPPPVSEITDAERVLQQLASRQRRGRRG